MRKLVTLALALGVFFAVSAGPAVAQTQVKVAVHVQETSAGVMPDGTSYAEGSYRVFLGGVLIEEGTTTSVYHISADGSFVEGYRTYVDSATGGYVMVDLRAHLVKATDDRFIYNGNEELTANSQGILSAHVGAHTTVKVADDGSYTLTGLGKWTIEF